MATILTFSTNKPYKEAVLQKSAPLNNLIEDNSSPDRQPEVQGALIDLCALASRLEL